MSPSRLSPRSLSVVVVLVALLAALLPGTALAAPGGKAREYIVTLAEGTRSIAPASRVARQRMLQGARRADEATDRVTRAHGVKAKHRYGYAFSGFSARMTPAQAVRVAADPSVASVRRARTFRIAQQHVPVGMTRVKARSGIASGEDVTGNVAIVDTGIGPAGANGQPIPMTSNELNIRGGINCHNPAPEAAGRWGDTQGHGTHVAGIVGARDNGVGAVGVAPGVGLWAVRVFGGSSGSETAVACGIDWAVATHAPDDGIPSIDVINLSIEGSRLDYQEDCDRVLGDPRGDPMQKAVCRAIQAGIVVVAAAGNWGGNANDSAPGGFDPVITVGAMTDTDGTGWGQGKKCAGERDDQYARYSNHGRAVDIVAPGTCVLSTSHTDPDGGALALKTGTSMAAPHVTGAVARYIEANGRPTSAAGVDQIRRIVRASGRLDWKLKSDPVWYGVNDPDPPNRVLDVSALTGANLVRAWVFHDRFRVGGAATKRTTRVDVQRGGGFAGTVGLSLTGLPGAAGNASFGDSTLDGLGPKSLGTKLTFALRKGAASEGDHALQVIADGGGAGSHNRSLSLLIDRTAPSIAGVHSRLRGGKAAMTRKGTAQTFVKWQVSDALSGVRSARLQRKNGSSPWRNAGSGGKASARVSLKPGQGSAFRVKATDALGNTRTSQVHRVRLSVRDSASPQWQKPAGQWKKKSVAKAFGGSILLASGPTDSITTSFKGRGVAVAGSVGPARGTFRVRIDGGPWSTVSLTTPKPGHRKVAWSRVLGQGKHTLELQGLTGQTALDAILILR